MRTRWRSESTRTGDRCRRGELVELQNRTVRYLLVAGQRARAVPVAQRAVTLAEKRLAERHPEALTSRIQLADALQWAGAATPHWTG